MLFIISKLNLDLRRIFVFNSATSDKSWTSFWFSENGTSFTLNMRILIESKITEIDFWYEKWYKKKNLNPISKKVWKTLSSDFERQMNQFNFLHYKFFVKSYKFIYWIKFSEQSKGIIWRSNGKWHWLWNDFKKSKLK